MANTTYDALEKFLLACRAEAKSPKTLRSYQDILKCFVNFVGDMQVDELTPDHIRGYIAELSTRPGVHGQFSTHSVHKHYSVVRTFIRWMYDQRMIKERLTDYTKAPRQAEYLPDVLTDEEIKELFVLLKDRRTYRDQVIFEMFLDTGIRLNELAELNLEDVYFQESFIRVYGKGRKEDLVPIGRTLAHHLRTYIDTERREIALPKENALFVNRMGERLGKEGVAILVRRVLNKVRGRGRIGPHILRHTFATKFIQGRGNLEALRRIMRHSKISLTQVYVHLQTEDLLAEHRVASPLDNLKNG
jgi:site-specific recombinase XerD